MIAGKPARFWIELFLGCYEKITGRPCYFVRIEWPDGRSFLEQDSIVVEALRTVQIECGTIEIERARKNA